MSRDPRPITRRRSLQAIAGVAAAAAGPSAGAAQRPRFELGKGQFMLDGRPLHILSGEMHFCRIPPAYWRHRLRMARAMGLNTVATYVMWNVHEPEEGRFRFSGEADVARFVRTAQQEGLHVMLRPGPYVCAEWEFGGFPYWLLRQPGLTVRSSDPAFLRYAARYLARLGEQLRDLQVENGGPILMVQVENEYGSYGSDRPYKEALRDAVRAAGFTVPLYTADGGSQMEAGHVEGALPCLNGGNAFDTIREVKRFRPDGPFMATEVYPGWLDHWGEAFTHGNAKSDVSRLTGFLDQGVGVNFYMIHGGTNFGFYNGANYGGSFEPSITSYDYGAPIDEAGRPRDAWHAMRTLIASRKGADAVRPVPAPSPIAAIPPIRLTEVGSVLGALPKPVRASSPMTMEALGQDYGFVLYRTALRGPRSGRLRIEEVRDYAIVMLDGKVTGKLDRRRHESALNLEVGDGDHTLDILVENGGRINYGDQITDNLKGITKRVQFAGADLGPWDHYRLPMPRNWSPALDGRAAAPLYRRGAFTLDTPADTWLDMRAWSKGAAWVNGHPLGRYWSIGPTQTLYVPAPYLRAGRNELLVLELIDAAPDTVTGVTEPILDDLRPEPPRNAARRPALTVAPDPQPAQMAAEGTLTDSANPQDVRFAAPASGRYLCFETLSSLDGSKWGSGAELYGLGQDGAPLDRGAWRIFWADSEEQSAEDGSADNLLDDDPETIWHTVWSGPGPSHPHRVVVDMGAAVTLTGIRYLQRRGPRPAKVARFRVYVSAEPFGAR